jgi:hypothetical protein
MTAGHDVDDDPTVLDPLHGLVAGGDRQFLAVALVDRDLAALSYSAAHTNVSCNSYVLSTMRSVSMAFDTHIISAILH